MIFVISPAKTLEFGQPAPVKKHTSPQFQAEANQLMSILKEFSQDELARLMNISQNLAELNTIRHSNWEEEHTLSNAKQSIYTFRGEVFNGLNIEQFNSDDLNFAQKGLRILSGLYGVLRPLDLIQPYRLEMSTKLENPEGKNLYEFWDDKIAQQIQKDVEKSGTNTLINLASNEYFKAIKGKLDNIKIITPVFKELKNDKYKVIAIYAKKARGLMSAFIIRNRIEKPEDLKNFQENGYMYDDNQSSDKEWVFTRS